MCVCVCVCVGVCLVVKAELELYCLEWTNHDPVSALLEKIGLESAQNLLQGSPDASQADNTEYVAEAGTDSTRTPEDQFERPWLQEEDRFTFEFDDEASVLLKQSYDRVEEDEGKRMSADRRREVRLLAHLEQAKQQNEQDVVNQESSSIAFAPPAKVGLLHQVEVVIQEREYPFPLLDTAAAQGNCQPDHSDSVSGKH